MLERGDDGDLHRGAPGVMDFATPADGRHHAAVLQLWQRTERLTELFV